MKVYEAVAAAVVAEGCGTGFGLVGDATLDVWRALVAGGVRILAARHEAAAVAMADGHARATGGVGLASVTSGPGLTQIGTSLVAAARNRTPLIVLAGEVASRDRYSAQRFDQPRFARACECEYVAVTAAGSVASEVAEAFHAARTQRRPVVIGLPTDVQQETIDWSFEYRASSDHRPVVPDRPPAAAIEALAARLLSASRPAIIAGRGAMSADARTAIVRLADHVGALLGTSLKAKGLFVGHPYDLGVCGAFAAAATEQVLAEADFVLGVGAELGFHTTEGGMLFPEAEVARIDCDPAPQALGIMPGLYVVGDAAATVTAVADRIAAQGIAARTGFRTADVGALLEQVSRPAFDPPSDGLDPRALARQIALSLPDGALLTVGAGHFWTFFPAYCPVGPEIDLRFSYQFGAIGQTIPLAAGVGVALPGRPHLIVEGDGSMMMHIQELETMVRCGIDAVVLVWNDCGFGAEVHRLRARGLDSGIAAWPDSPDFVAMAKAAGGDGTVLRDLGDLESMLRRAFDSGGVFLIDARVSPTVVSDPYLKVHFGIPNAAPLLAGRGRAR